MIPALTLAAKHWRETAIAALVLACWALSKDNKALKAQVAAKPAIESHIEKKEDTKTTSGPVKTTEKFAVVPGNCVPVLIERVVEAAPVVVEKIVEVSRDRSERPAPVSLHGANQFLIGGSANPARAQDGQLVHLGIGFQNILDLTYGHSLPGQPERHDIRFVTRWGR